MCRDVYFINSVSSEKIVEDRISILLGSYIFEGFLIVMKYVCDLMLRFF